MTRFTDLVSIIMPVYNGEQFIAEAIQSVVDQNYEYWELIVINDGSTDDTKRVILDFSDTRIRYFEQPNGGVSAARNLGIREMRGKYLCCLDADDFLPPNSIFSRLNVFQSSDDISFVDGRVRIFDSTLTGAQSEWVPTFKGVPFYQLVRLNGRCFFGPTWMVKSESVGESLFDEKLSHGEDLLFYVSIAKKGIYDYTDECILHYRSNSNSAMSNFDGLANGYSYLCSAIWRLYYTELSMLDRILILFRSRKIMFLTFWSQEEYLKAFKFVMLGHI
ncbi:MAG: glycosyltransferase family 2 protein [Cyclobacteriaceae bacterium]|nr:glycosyltransferase family 2 protein [Cyclobacteriaceae bacterium]